MQEEYLYEGAKNYLRLEKKEGFRNELKMLERGRIPGLLPAREKSLNGVEYLYYEVGSFVNIRDVYLKRKLDRKLVGKLFEILVRQQEHLSEYLLDERWLLTDPKYLFMDMAAEELFFVYYPGGETDIWEQYGNLIEFLIRSGDYGDEALIEKIYSFYDLIMCKSFSLSKGLEQMRELLKTEEPSEKKDHPEAERTPEQTDLAGEEGSPEKKGAWEERFAETGQRKAGAAPRITKAAPPDAPEYPLEEEAPKDQMHSGGSAASKILRLVPIPCALLEIFFLYVLMNMNLSRQELVLLAAGAVSAPVMAAVCLFLAKMLKEREEDSEEEFSMEPERPAERQGRAALPPAVSHAAGEEGESKTRFFEGAEQAENKLYGIGKNRRVIRLENLPFIIGKSKEHVDYQLSDSSVSRMHAKITAREGKVYLTDLNSTNGTFKNGLRLLPGESTLLEREDEVRLGKLEFAFR